jgi:hypothetical protein
MKEIECVKKKIEKIIKNSLVSEDPIHSKNTLEWLLKLKPDADEALKIAALAHDIERAIEKRKVKRKDYRDYDEFKNAHALNSAKILLDIMKECNAADDVFRLIRFHETGGSRRVNILRGADGISFFHVNLPEYFSRNGKKETEKRWFWGYRRLSEKEKIIIAKFNYQDKELNALVTTWLGKSQLCL